MTPIIADISAVLLLVAIAAEFVRSHFKKWKDSP